MISHEPKSIGKPRVSPLLSVNTSAVIRYLIELIVFPEHMSSPLWLFLALYLIMILLSIFMQMVWKHCAPRISSKMATIDEFALKNIGL
jgi:hypothetical protein